MIFFPFFIYIRMVCYCKEVDVVCFMDLTVIGEEQVLLALYKVPFLKCLSTVVSCFCFPVYNISDLDGGVLCGWQYQTVSIVWEYRVDNQTG